MIYIKDPTFGILMRQCDRRRKGDKWDWRPATQREVELIEEGNHERVVWEIR